MIELLASDHICIPQSRFHEQQRGFAVSDLKLRSYGYNYVLNIALILQAYFEISKLNSILNISV